MNIKELIVVEGKDDIAAVKRAVTAEVVATGGFGFGADLISLLQAALKRTGLVIFTDPDTAGNRIRAKLAAQLPGCKHAYLSQAEAIKGRNIGIENASPQAIQEALAIARQADKTERTEFTLTDLIGFGLAGTSGAQAKRIKTGKLLGIGDTNTKQFLNRLNHQGITPQELAEAVKEAGR